MNVAKIECPAGASGDMFLGAWLDLGVDEASWRRMLAGLAVDEYEIVVERVKRRGIAATKVHVHTRPSPHHRHLRDIRAIVDASDLPDVVKEKTMEAFTHLAEAEAAVHGTTPESIHFHEVGAVDAIVDIAGTMIAWHLLGQPECVVGPIEVGGGTVECAHGRMPVPAPATERLLQGYPTYSSGVFGETTTPTGAAILRTLAKPAERRVFIGHKSGYGAGTKELPVANVLRIQLGAWADVSADAAAIPDTAGVFARILPVAAGDAAARAAGCAAGDVRQVEAVVIEANVDDMSPEAAGYVLERLLGAGAMDAWWVPVVMKKGRPALMLRALCAPYRSETADE